MTKMEEIQQEIDKLEKKDLTYDIVRKLAILYIVKDHMRGADMNSASGPMIQQSGPAAPPMLR